MALEGGIKGAQVDRRSLVRMKSELLEKRARNILDGTVSTPVLHAADAKYIEGGGF
jgi:hypothetical protein